MTLREFDRLDESERAYWIADWQIEQTTCQSHGGPVAECSDPDRLWYPQRRVCFATMEREAAVARYRELHEAKPFHNGAFGNWSKVRNDEAPYHFGEGVSIIATAVDYAPDDDFLGRSAPDEPGPGEDGED